MKNRIGIVDEKKVNLAEKFQKIFEAEKKKLLFSQKGILSEDFHLPKEDMMDESDMTSSLIEQNMQLRLRNREALHLKNIESALAKIEDGTFGECEDCGVEIDERRLEVRPTTKLCIQCKEEQEQSEHSFSDGRKPKSIGQIITLRA